MMCCSWARNEFQNYNICPGARPCSKLVTLRLIEEFQGAMSAYTPIGSLRTSVSHVRREGTYVVGPELWVRTAKSDRRRLAPA